MFLLFVTTSNCYASKIKKGYEALEVYNYFEAKRLFEKSTKKHPVAAYFGLSIIYARKDNPFSNLDSAHVMISRSFEAFPRAKLKLKEKYKKYQLDSMQIVSQRANISKLYFERAKNVNSIFGYQDFIDKNKWSIYLDSSVLLRDGLAFEIAMRDGSAKGYLQYIETYPNSAHSKNAKELYHKSNYAEQTEGNSYVEYLNFVKNHPDSPYKDEAEDKIYEFATKTGTEEGYRSFIVEHPTNRNMQKAWVHLYNARLKEKYSSESILAFSKEYPDYPYKADLMKELSMADKVFYPVKSNGFWGFCDKDGNSLIEPQYDGVEWFQEGLTVCRIGDKFGYINKIGQIKIAATFDDALPFNEGHALVELNEQWGLIDRNGEYIIPAKFEDLGELKNGLCYFQEADHYGYFDENGMIRLKANYSEAYDFEEGYAVVSKNDYYGVIDQFGTTFLPFKYDDIFHYQDNFYCASYKGYWGVISLESDTLIPFEYDYIGKPNNGYTIVEMDDEFNFINEKGEEVYDLWKEIYPEHRQLAMFKDGYSKIKFEDGFNLIDTSGAKLFKKEAEDLGLYSSLIAIKNNGLWGFQDVKGKMVIPFTFDYATSFSEGTAIIKTNPFFGLINEEGEFLIGPYQEELKFVNDSLLIAKSVGKYGIIDVEGDTLLNYRYNKIEPISDIIVHLEEGEDVYYYNLKSATFIRREE